MLGYSFCLDFLVIVIYKGFLLIYMGDFVEMRNIFYYERL